jgi:hypothetical protein
MGGTHGTLWREERLIQRTYVFIEIPKGKRPREDFGVG